MISRRFKPAHRCAALGLLSGAALCSADLSPAVENDAGLPGPATDTIVTRAMENPEGFYRTGSMDKLIAAAIRPGPFGSPVIDSNALAKAKNLAASSPSPEASCVIGLLIFAINPDPADTASTIPALRSASTAFRMLDNDKSAVALYQALASLGVAGATDSLACIVRYVNYDKPARALLDVVWQDLPVPDQHSYEKKVRLAFRDLGPGVYRAELCRRIGDICYEQKRYLGAIRWYSKTIAIDSTLGRTTTAGFRLEDAGRLMAYKGIELLCLTILVLAAGLLFSRSRFSSRAFDLPFFFRRLALLLSVTLAVIIVWSLLDLAVVRRGVEALIARPDTKALITAPVVMYPFLDPSRPLLLITALAALLLPLATATAVASLTRPFGRFRSLLLVLAVAAACWTLFYLHNACTTTLFLQGVPEAGRFYFRGDIETLLAKNPQKIFNANQAFFKSDNRDLQIFLNKKFPNGVPVSKK